MNLFTLARRAALVPLALSVLSAGETRTWSQSEFADFERGNLKNLSLRSDGLLTVAPRARELYDTNLPYLWSLALDSKGNLYAGGGSPARLFRIAPDGKGQVLAELDSLAVQAVAIDSQDRLYAATSPDGKVYRVSAGGKPEVFYDPKTKYIWGLAFDPHGNLMVATGDPGEIHKVAPDGKGAVFFRTGETHARSLALDHAGNLIIGTAPGGLVLRVSPAGEGFVVFQMSKKEVTAVAIAPDGSIYAAASGSKQGSSGPLPQISSTPTLPATVSVSPPGSPAQPAVHSGAPSPALGVPALASGGSEVYSIDAEGVPSRIWSHEQDVVYAIAFDSAGRPILATGNHGKLYRVESPSLQTQLRSFETTQITALANGRDGRLYAASGNVGMVYEIGPDLESEGTLESEVFDAGMFTLWGRLSFEASLKGGHVALRTRSGNLEQPEKDWSAWSAPIADPKGARIDSPSARFVQWKATLSGAAELESVDVAFLPKNVAPRIDTIEITPPNYKFPPPSVAAPVSASPATINLPPLRSRTASATPGFTGESVASSTATPTLQWAKGEIGVRWLASDPNSDTLVYALEIRGVNETAWKPLRGKLTEKYFSWDSTAFPDGEYRLRVTASDAPSNPPAEALTGSLESDRFLIDNTPPAITGLLATRSADKIAVRWHAADALNIVTNAEYSLDGGAWTIAAPEGHVSDSLDLDYALTVVVTPGEHTIAVRATDDYDNQSTAKAVVK